jgi:hypothetical protein
VGLLRPLRSVVVLNRDRGGWVWARRTGASSMVKSMANPILDVFRMTPI